MFENLCHLSCLQQLIVNWFPFAAPSPFPVIHIHEDEQIGATFENEDSLEHTEDRRKEKRIKMKSLGVGEEQESASMERAQR